MKTHHDTLGTVRALCREPRAGSFTTGSGVTCRRCLYFLSARRELWAKARAWFRKGATP